MAKKPSSVLTIVYDKSKSFILLVKRRDVPMWVLPGGGIDPGEEAESAAAREVLEESGLHINQSQLVAQYTTLNKLAQDTALFTATAVDGIFSDSNESYDASFFRRDEFPENTFYIHKDWIEEISMSSEIIRRPLCEVTYYTVFKYFVRHPFLFLRYLRSWLGFPKNENA